VTDIEKSVVIRQAEMLEAQYLTELAFRSKAHWGYSDEFMALCEQELMVLPEHILAANYRYFVAQVKGVIIGFYALEYLSNQQYELQSLFVAPEFIGTGIGRALMQHAKESVVQNGGGNLIIQGDPNTQEFYLAAGATFVGERESGSIAERTLPVFSIILKPK